jgi:precorrin-6Y C5,15-methyltransferase (decarboxylating)
MIPWHGLPIDVVGLGVSSRIEQLPAAHREAIEQATVIFGSERHLAMLVAPTQQASLTATQLCYPSPFTGLAALLPQHQRQRVVLLASGDPLFFGIGGWLTRRFAPQALRFHSNVSSIQVACARIGAPWQQADVISLHGRPLASLHGRLRGGRLIALLTDSDNHPAAIAAALRHWGQQDAQCWVLEALGSERERVQTFSAAELAASDQQFDPLNVMLLRTVGGTNREFPGFADTEFNTDATAGNGMISKREVRLMVLSLLQPAAGEIGWDIGAGCGGVAIEWALSNPLGTLVAVENHPKRIACLRSNRQKFAVESNLQVVTDTAPDCLTGLPDPDCVFIGGGGKDLAEILIRSWNRLRPAGRLVASAVTETSRATLLQFASQIENQSSIQPEWSQLAISRPQQLAGQLVLKPRLPVLLMKFSKPA